MLLAAGYLAKRLNEIGILSEVVSIDDKHRVKSVIRNKNKKEILIDFSDFPGQINPIILIFSITNEFIGSCQLFDLLEEEDRMSIEQHLVNGQ